MEESAWLRIIGDAPDAGGEMPGNGNGRQYVSSTVSRGLQLATEPIDGGRQPPWGWPEALALAMIRNGLDDVRMGNRRRRGEACSWFLCSSSDWPLAYTTICDNLGIEPTPIVKIVEDLDVQACEDYAVAIRKILVKL